MKDNRAHPLMAVTFLAPWACDISVDCDFETQFQTTTIDVYIIVSVRLSADNSKVPRRPTIVKVINQGSKSAVERSADGRASFSQKRSSEM